MTQDQLNSIFSTPNTIYRIVSEIGLENNQTINVPENSTLLFEGGRIKSGTTGECYLTGDNTKLVFNGYKKSYAIDPRVQIRGTFLDAAMTRPTGLNNHDSGLCFYDRDKEKPVWWTQNSSIGRKNGWIDADGIYSDTKRIGTWAEKPDIASVPIGFRYYCTDKYTPEGAMNNIPGVLIIAGSNGHWLDPCDRIINDNYPAEFYGPFADKPTLGNYQANYKYFDTTNRRTIIWSGSRWVTEDGVPADAKRRGTWSEIPNIASVPVGFMYYCTDKKAPEASEGIDSGVAIFASSSGYWVDTLGRKVNSEYPALYKGAFADKPSPAAYQAGLQYFDTTNYRIIIWNGSAWVDATGATV